jgi:signal transduction histidine kinase
MENWRNESASSNRRENSFAVAAVGNDGAFEGEWPTGHDAAWVATTRRMSERLSDGFVGQPVRELAKRIGGGWVRAVRAARLRWRPSLRESANSEPAAEAGAKLFVVRATHGGMVFEWVNPAFETATGISLAQLAGRPLDEVLPAVLAVTLTRCCRECLLAGGRRRYISTLPLADRQLRWSIVLTLNPARGKRDPVIVGSARDADDLVDSVPVIHDDRAGLWPAFTAGPDRRLQLLDGRAFERVGQPLNFGPEATLTEGALRHKRQRRYDEADANLTGDGGVLERGKLVFWNMTDSALKPLQAPLEAFKDFAESLPAEMALLDRHGRLVAGNAAWRAGAGDAAEDLVGASYVEIGRRLIPGFDEAAFRHGIDALLAGRRETLSLSYLSGNQASPPRQRELRVTPVRVAGQQSLAVVHWDPSDSVAGVRSQEGAEALLAVRERERQRIAIELHDSTSQHLVALGLGVARLRRLVGGRGPADRVLTDMSKSVDEAVKEIRVLSYLMMPPGLQKEGLRATVGRFVKGFESRTGLQAVFRADGEVDDVSSAVKHAALRVVQEALSNVYRHAEARGVEVSIARRTSSLTIHVADDGKGIPSLRDGGPGPNLGVGVTGMQARVAQLGGTLQITSARIGAEVTVTLPAFAAAANVRPSAKGPT